MTQFNEIKIISIDANRPPRVRKEAYIDLFYQLSEDAPEEWCEDFSGFGRHVNPLAKIEKGTRCFIEAKRTSAGQRQRHPGGTGRLAI
jgi:hypothetical protein